MNDSTRRPQETVIEGIRALIQPGHTVYRPKGLLPLIDELLNLGHESQRRKVDRSTYKLRCRAAVEETLGRCAKVWKSDPVEALKAARLAHYMALHLPVIKETGGKRMPLDCQALALGYIGNCHRLLRSYDAAENTFELAEEVRVDGSGDSELFARLCSFRASLARDTGDFVGALVLLRRSIAEFESVGDEAGQGRALQKAALVPERGGRIDAAIKTHFTACALLEDSDAEESAGAWLNLALFLVVAGRPLDATGVLQALGDLERDIPAGSSVLLSRIWIEGLIALADGRHTEAEAHLSDAIRKYEARRDPVNVALANLDLARVRLAQGDRKSLYQSLAVLVKSEPLFCHPEARRAVRELGKLKAADRITTEVLESAVATLRGRRC